MPIDKESFLAGLQLGRRLKVLEAKREVEPETDCWILTETELPILAEDGEELEYE